MAQSEKEKEAAESADMHAGYQMKNAMQAMLLLRGLDDDVRKAVLRVHAAESDALRMVTVSKAVVRYRDRLYGNLTYVPQMPADHPD